MNKGSFIKTKAEIDNFLRILTETTISNAEALVVAWETDPRVLERLIPKPLKIVGPWVMAYVENYPETEFCRGYCEGALMVPIQYCNKSMTYMISLLLSPKSDMPICLGRENNGFPKKEADEIKLYKNGGNSGFSINRHGVDIISVKAENGRFNSPDGDLLFGGYEVNKEIDGSSISFKYDLEYKNNSMRFSNVRFMSSPTTNIYTSVERARITKLILNPSLDDPWAELKVVRPLGALYFKGKSIWYAPKTLLRLCPDDYEKYLFSRWDTSVLGYESRNFEYK